MPDPYILPLSGSKVSETLVRTSNSDITVEQLIEYLTNVVTLPDPNTVFRTAGRSVIGDSPIRQFVCLTGSHTDNGGTIRTIYGDNYIKMVYWDGDVRDFENKAAAEAAFAQNLYPSTTETLNNFIAQTVNGGVPALREETPSVDEVAVINSDGDSVGSGITKTELVELQTDKADRSLLNVDNNSVTYGLLATDVQASIAGNLDPENYLGSITSLTFNFADPTTNTGKWFFIDGVSGTFTGTNAPTGTSEDGGYVFSDGTSWLLRGATPVHLLDGQVTLNKLGTDAKERQLRIIDDYQRTFAVVDEDDRVGLAIRNDGKVECPQGILGLENIDNTADLQKPVSNATQTALDFKLEATDLSVTENNASGGGSLSYDSANGVFEYTPPLITAGAVSDYVLDGSRRILPNVPNTLIYASGDSMATNWPLTLGDELNVTHFTSAIGGSKSFSQIGRTEGIELSYPIKGTDTITSGTISVKFNRHQADRTTVNSAGNENQSVTDTYRNKWSEYAQLVTTPDTVEVFNNGKLLGFAEHLKNDVTTNYSSDVRKLYWTAHPLQNGDIVSLWVKNDTNRPTRIAQQEANSWYQSPNKPTNLYEYRCYFVTNAGTNDFEICEYESQVGGNGIDLGSNATGVLECEYGWGYEWDYDGGDWNLEFKVRSDISNAIFLLQVATNDISTTNSNSFYTITAPNIWRHIEAMESHFKRFVMVAIGVSNSSGNGPTGEAYKFTHEKFIPYCRKAFGDLFVDWLPVLEANRTSTELGFLSDPTVPELLHIRGTPTNSATWEAFSTDQGDTSERWVGPGYYPLQYRPSFSDTVHLNNDGLDIVKDEVLKVINNKNWI